MDLSERRRCPAGQVVKSCIEGKTNKDWIKESGERKSDAANDKKICRNAQTSLDRSIKRRWRVEKQTENKEKTIKRIKNEKRQIEKESQAEKTSEDEKIKRRRFEGGDIEKESQAEKKTNEDKMIKRRRFEEGEIEKKSQVEKKTSEGKSIKKRAVEEGQLQKERQAKKKSSKLERIKTSQVAKDDKKIKEDNSKERNLEQNEGNSGRSRPEDLLEGGSIQKRPRLDIERPAPLDSNNYKFHTVLGQGGFGQVMLASFRPNKQLVAIKILKKQKNDCYSIAKEARVLKISRECAFLCQSHATFQSELEAFFVLEYASGKSLWQMIMREGGLPMSTIMFYTAEMVVALQFLHSKGIIHRDLKPDNILVDKDGHIKICDFGIAEENIFGQRKTYGLAGTPGYRAPEILLKEDYNTAVDWWSFGVTMYEMATGELPYSTSGSILRQRYMILNKTPKYPCYMSEEMLDLLPKLLEIDNTKRIGQNGNIREHPFYSTINWDDLENRRLKTPFKPEMPSADDLDEYPLTFSPHSCDGKNLKDFSEVDPNWNWQE